MSVPGSGELSIISTGEILGAIPSDGIDGASEEGDGGRGPGLGIAGMPELAGGFGASYGEKEVGAGCPNEVVYLSGIGEAEVVKGLGIGAPGEVAFLIGDDEDGGAGGDGVPVPGLIGEKLLTVLLPAFAKAPEVSFFSEKVQ